MNEFKSFGIKPTDKGFSGEKISVQRILNIDIIIEAFKESTSKFEGKGMRLDLQIIHEGKQRVVFVSSKTLLDMIKKVPADKFPFTTKIVNENNRLEFT